MQTLGLNQQLNASTMQQKKNSGMVTESVNLCIQHMDNQKHLTGHRSANMAAPNQKLNTAALIQHLTNSFLTEEPLQWIVCTRKLRPQVQGSPRASVVSASPSWTTGCRTTAFLLPLVSKRTCRRFKFNHLLSWSYQNNKTSHVTSISNKGQTETFFLLQD